MTTMTTTQAATALNLSIRTIQRRCATGKLTATKDLRGRWNITMEATVTDLPALTGPADYLIHQAEGYRDAMLTQLAEQITASAGLTRADLLTDLIALYREVALRHTDFGWWMANNGRQLAPIVQRELTADDKARLMTLRSAR